MSGLVLLTGAAGRIGTCCAAGCPSAAGRCAASTSSRSPTSARARSRWSPTSPTSPRWSTPSRASTPSSTWPASSASPPGRRSATPTSRAPTRRSRRPGGPASSGWCWPAATTPPGSPRGRPTGLLREEDAPPRPDTYYGVAKVTMEALGSLYADRYGMDVVCLRIGSAFPEPTTVRHAGHLALPRRHRLARRRRADARRPRASPWCGASRPTPATGGTSPPPARSATSRPTTPRSTPRR